MSGRIEQIRAAHLAARPKPAVNPAWANAEHDIGVLLAEIQRLRTGLGALLSVAPDTLGCGRNCSAEIDGDTEDEYAMSLRAARAAFSGEADNG